MLKGDDGMKWIEKFNCSNSREGIESRMRLRGMDYLELMAKGKCVIAYDLPTHSEYISDGYNGILFNKYEKLDLSNWKQIGINAKKSISKEHKCWLMDKDRIIDWVNK